MSQEEKKTFLEGLLIFLADLPGVLNDMLKVCGENIPYVGKFLQPAVWSMIGLMVMQWGLEGVGLYSYVTGFFDGVINTLGNWLSWIPGVTFTGDAVALPSVEVTEVASGAASSTGEIPVPPAT